MPVGVSAYVPLATKTLTATATSVTFSSISQAYRDLVLVVDLISSTSQPLLIRFNSDSGANYSLVNAGGNGTTTSSVAPTGRTSIYAGQIGYPNGSPGYIAKLDIVDYSAVDKHKTLLSRAGNAAYGLDMLAGRWASTAAITTITATTGGGNTYNIGSIFTLYGIAA